MATTPAPARRVVVRAPNWLGDAVLALPALAGIRRHFAGDHLTIAAVASVAALYREDTAARPDRVIDLPADRRRVVAALAEGRFDVGVLLPNSFRSAWQLRRAGVRERWGFASGGRGLLLTRKSPKPPSGSSGPLHQSDYYRALVRGLGMSCDDGPPIVRASAESLARARTLLEQHGAPSGVPMVGLAPGAAYGQAKQWPPARMAGVIARLSAERRATCVIVGAAHDRPAAREIESWLRAHAGIRVSQGHRSGAGPNVIDAVGTTDLGMLVGLASLCQVFVSNDSGAMHVAAAAGSRVVALFGPTDARATGPVGGHDVLTAPVFCRPCHLRDCPIDHRCMTRISVDTVFDAVAARLTPAAAS